MWSAAEIANVFSDEKRQQVEAGLVGAPAHPARDRRASRDRERERKFALLGHKELSLDEVSESARKLLRQHSVNELAMVVHFAKLVAPDVEYVLEAMRTLH